MLHMYIVYSLPRFQFPYCGIFPGITLFYNRIEYHAKFFDEHFGTLCFVSNDILLELLYSVQNLALVFALISTDEIGLL